MKGSLLVSVSQDILDDWEKYGPEVARMATEAAGRAGGELLPDAPELFVRADGITNVLFKMLRK